MVQVQILKRRYLVHGTVHRELITKNTKDDGIIVSVMQIGYAKGTADGRGRLLRNHTSPHLTVHFVRDVVGWAVDNQLAVFDH
ncbi:hypothetical protein D3C73_1282540 [compost metagenome]